MQINYDFWQLDNKTKVVLVPIDGVESVTVMVMYKVGSRYETEKINGISHFIEHLMFKGTKKRPNTLVLTREIDRLGAHYNAFTGKEYTGYYIKIAKNYTQVAIDILADMLENSLFSPIEMEREKRVIVEEIRMYKDNPLINIENIFEELLYQGCPLGWDIAGTEEKVLNYSPKEVLKYKDRYYKPANRVVVVAGCLDSKIKTYLKKYFGKKQSNFRQAQIKPAQFARQKNKLRIEQKKTDQAQLMLGFPAFAVDNPDVYKAKLLNIILGGTMSSRLFIKIRERHGLAYMVRSGIETFADTGYQYIRVGLEPKNINKTIKLIKKELEKISSKIVNDKELKDAKKHLAGSLALEFENTSAHANWFAHQVLFHQKIKTPKEELEEINKLSAKDLLKVAQKMFKWSQVRVAIIGDIEADKIKF